MFWAQAKPNILNIQIKYTNNTTKTQNMDKPNILNCLIL